MDEEEVLSNDDIVQQYYKNIVIYNTKLVFVSHCKDGIVTLNPVGVAKNFNVKFERKLFKPCLNRIGMINVLGSVIYGSRNPVRKMQIGHNRNNISLHYIKGLEYKEGAMATKDYLYNVNCVEIGNSLENNYPTFEKALEIIDKKSGINAVAFDKQFCLDKLGNIYYKLDCVGKVKDKRIEFKSGKEHLELLLENSYEQYI
jgi:hypothetical protein